MSTSHFSLCILQLPAVTGEGEWLCSKSSHFQKGRVRKWKIGWTLKRKGNYRSIKNIFCEIRSFRAVCLTSPAQLVPRRRLYLHSLCCPDTGTYHPFLLIKGNINPNILSVHIPVPVSAGRWFIAALLSELLCS